MLLSDLLQPDCIKVPLAASDKQGAIFELVNLLAERGRIRDAEALQRAVWARESTRTTGIGHGLAIPHGKSSCCDRLVMAIGKPPEPIDFDAIDSRPVSVIFLVAGPPDQTGPHIQALARISRLMTDETFRRSLIQADDAQFIYDKIVQQERVAAQ